MSHSLELRAKARRLRKSGLSYNEIAESLGLPKSTIRYWIRDVSLGKVQAKRLAERRRRKARSNAAIASKTMQENAAARREEARNRGRELADGDEETRLIAALYWAEGEKGRNSFSLSNADADMLALVLKWLQKQVETERITFRVSFHAANGRHEKEIVRWWLEKLPGLAPSNVGKSTKWPTNNYRGKKTGKVPFGVGRLTVNSTELRALVGGAIDFLKGR